MLIIIRAVSVDVSSIVQVTNPLHFPLTAGSYWTYADLTSHDTITRYVNGDSIINAASFVKVTELNKQNSFYQQNYFYNYNAGDYNQFQK